MGIHRTQTNSYASVSLIDASVPTFRALSATASRFEFSGGLFYAREPP